MKSFVSTSATAIATAVALLIAPTWEIAAEEKTFSKQYKQVEQKMMRKVAPNRGRVVRGSQQYKAQGPGGTAAVCCTHWNTSTGGTGCATYPDSCPDNTFTVECGDDGCW